ncbi:shikimate kinase [Paenibacillus sp. GbtcB18]|uniref:shikimate kinase n=1 Tax=Paenibacillus sp. GbtcB18 TaxID=2824763 RepID=UPI001C30287C|nr:shikimate kinase [Paenibacillus sp. GbtcB18]
MSTQPRSNIVLIGFMGTGKTTVGLKLADRLGWPMIDTDEEIVKKAGMSIPELFATHGEAHFRTLEREVVRETLAGSHRVISTGGGAVLAEENRACMSERGFVAALSASLETIVERVKNDSNRPLLQGSGLEEKVRTMLQERQDAYRFADLTIDTSPLAADDIAEHIFNAWTKERLKREEFSG